MGRNRECVNVEKGHRHEKKAPIWVNSVLLMSFFKLVFLVVLIKKKRVIRNLTALLHPLEKQLSLLFIEKIFLRF